MVHEPDQTAQSHVPVLLDEVLKNLLYRKSGIFVDATFGRGGHTRAILGALDADARVVGFDRDPVAVAEGERLAEEDARFAIHHAKFGELERWLDEPVDGVLMDVGVSSPQVDDPTRGFSFSVDGPLDMRMDPSAGEAAADWLNTAEVGEIADVLRRFGEEKQAGRIARAIVKARPLATTLELAEVVAAAMPQAVLRGMKKHPATRTFQALRIRINDELGELERGLDAAFNLLKPGGRLAVISFHSLEDRIVKQKFRALSQPPPMPRRLPVQARPEDVAGEIVCGPLSASALEVRQNPRARSAKLRVIQKRAAGDAA